VRLEVDGLFLKLISNQTIQDTCHKVFEKIGLTCPKIREDKADESFELLDAFLAERSQCGVAASRVPSTTSHLLSQTPMALLALK